MKELFENICLTQQYELKEILGRGGNAIVRKISSKANMNENFALKILVHNDKEKRSRFLQEIQFLKRLKDDPLIEVKHLNIIPILENVDITNINKDNINDLNNKNKSLWYTMPIAICIMDYIKTEPKNDKDKINNIAEGIIQLADTLHILHSKEIIHRDIKPDNIYYYNDGYALGDFGLMKNQEIDLYLTQSNRGVGAIFTIAPEMKRNPKMENVKPADIYSLAKTFWGLLNEENKCFDGQFNPLNETHKLNRKFTNSSYNFEKLGELLREATSDIPECRPTANDFKTKIKEWLKIFN